VFSRLDATRVRFHSGSGAGTGRIHELAYRPVEDRGRCDGKIKSVVTIWEEAGKLYGRVQKLVNPDPKDPNPRCTSCTGEQKGRPVVGLKILWDLQKDGNAWSGGTILDQESGKMYKCLLSLQDGGEKLKVRGFIGLSLFGRTQYWLRDQ
jgi:uncharacterized protein (DUF2147 family)